MNIDDIFKLLKRLGVECERTGDIVKFWYDATPMTMADSALTVGKVSNFLRNNNAILKSQNRVIYLALPTSFPEKALDSDSLFLSKLEIRDKDVGYFVYFRSVPIADLTIQILEGDTRSVVHFKKKDVTFTKGEKIGFFSKGEWHDKAFNEKDLDAREKSLSQSNQPKTVNDEWELENIKKQRNNLDQYLTADEMREIISNHELFIRPVVDYYAGEFRVLSDTMDDLQKDVKANKGTSLRLISPTTSQSNDEKKDN